MSEALSMLALGLAAQGGGGTTYTAGEGIAINSDNEISALVDGETIQFNEDGELTAVGGGTTYTAGEGITIENDEIGVDFNTVATNYSVDAKIAEVESEITEVSGTNDGTNWTSLTIDDDTYDIPSGGSEGTIRYDEAQTLTETQQMQARANQGLPYNYSENTELREYGTASFQLGKIDSSISWNSGIAQVAWDAFFKPNTIFYISIGTSSSEPLETVRCKVRNINTFNCLTDTTNMSIFNYDTTSNYIISRTGINIAYKGQPSYITGYVGMTYDAIKIGNKLTKDYMDAPLLDVSNVGNDGSINTGISFYGATASKYYHGITMGNKANISLQGDYSLAGGYANGSGYIEAYNTAIAFGRSNGNGTISARGGLGSICVGLADEEPTDGQGSMGTHGAASQAFGYQTKAGSNYQMAIGKNNIRDNNQTYAFIIGNGENISNRSNALTVDWEGNLVCNNIPAPPSADGEYDLHCSIVDGAITYSWVARE